MFALKKYQKCTLEILEKYLFQAKLRDPKTAFSHIVKEFPTDNIPQVYNIRWDLEDVPYVCLRLPTGGGKTLLATHAIDVARQNYLSRDLPFVLWLVPTNTIRKQTVQALKKASHPYCEALTNAFGLQNVCVIDIDDINNLRPKDVFDKACIVVSTMQTLRVEESNKDVRKVYGHNENFEPHFKALSHLAPDLDRDENGNVYYSFVNLVHQLQPLIIIDEAHKMVSKLSGEVMKRLNPTCVIEFTATPVESNVLYRVFPSELKMEEMVKLPFHLTEHPTWERALLDAIGTRTKLAQFATQDTENYIRPIVLFQAEKKGNICTVDVLKDFLLENGIAENEIAIATGEQRELDDIDLFDKTCPINYVITVEALKEGWDCSFAYVFCSVANIHSATDVEQLLGRVMRMPYARARKQKELNIAYAHVLAPSFGEAAEGMYSHLLNMGFNANEAANNIQQGQLVSTSNDVWGDSPLGKLAQGNIEPVFELILNKEPDFTDIPQEDMENISLEEKEGKFVLKTINTIPHVVEECVLKVVKQSEHNEVRRKIALHSASVLAKRPKSPSQENVLFAVPRMLVEIFGSLEYAEPEAILYSMDWSPLDYITIGVPPVDSNSFNYDQKAKAFIFDLEGEKLVYKENRVHEQYTLYAVPKTWTENSLSRWLDARCRQDDIKQTDMLEFCRRAIQGLLEQDGLDIETLYRARDALVVVIKNKIIQLRQRAQKKGFQKLFFAPTSHVEISFDEAFKFPLEGYAENCTPYNGAYQFKKHYYPIPRDLQSSGEEFRCAQALDAHPLVKMWVRNVDRQYGSFFLPTSTDKFYPDFVAILNDDRIVLIEYKGAHLLSTDDTKEKCNIGELWAKKSKGRGIFFLVSEGNEDLKLEVQMKKCTNINNIP